MKKRFFQLILVLLIVILIVTGWMAYQEYRLWTSPWGKTDLSITIEIKEGMTAKQVGEILRKDGVIPHTRVFLALADIRGFTKKIRAGEYVIRGASSPYEIVDLLAIGLVHRRKLIIPEGFTQIQIADRCEKLEICKKADFLAECQKNSVFSLVIAQAPEGANAALEGSLFPDTYGFERNTPAEKVVTRMIRNFNSVWDDILAQATKDPTKIWWWQKPGQSDAIGMQSAVILASIIEKEAKQPKDRPKIASVFVNRLKKGMPLQADSTIHYALNNWSRPLTSQDLEIDSPYNTYKHNGLPPSAICNPGRAALTAAAMPPDTTFLFFITKDNGETSFTNTHDEHVQIKNAMKRERRQNAVNEPTVTPPTTTSEIPTPIPAPPTPSLEHPSPTPAAAAVPLPTTPAEKESLSPK